VIVHLVLFRPRADLPASSRDTLVAALSATLQQIGSIRRARFGWRVTHGRPYEALMRTDYSHAAILEFDDAAGLQAYLEHPAHQQLASRFFEAFEEALMYDFELREGEEGIAALAGE
jgi:stress responsive alpha/beta barrel protein